MVYVSVVETIHLIKWPESRCKYVYGMERQQQWVFCPAKVIGVVWQKKMAVGYVSLGLNTETEAWRYSEYVYV